jgi:hypothetical protein
VLVTTAADVIGVDSDRGLLCAGGDEERGEERHTAVAMASSGVLVRGII